MMIKQLLIFPVVLCLLPGIALGVSDLDDKTQFTKIAKNGFKYTVNGNIFANPINHTGYPNLQANNLGGPENSYAWSMAWFNDQLYVGTNRMVFCTSAYGGAVEQVCANSLVDLPLDGVSLPGPQWRGEIWRYTPGNGTSGLDEGLSGIWQRFYQSPSWELPDGSIYDLLPTTVARDTGYRMMTTCDAGDGTPRLYVATLGMPGNILFYAGNPNPSPVSTSREGTYTSDAVIDAYFSSIIAGQPGDPFDLGYRALTCFKGHLWASPAGTFGDPDVATHPVVLMNPDPANGAAWQQVLDVSDPSTGPKDDTGQPLANADNGGIFQMEAIGNYLFLSVGNRSTGFELWRGDGSTCFDEGVEPCPVWEKIIANGAGRPSESPDRTTPANAGATLGVFGNDLYMGLGESGYAPEGLTAAELLRIKDAGTGSKQWELLVGWPRKDYADPDISGAWNKNFTCEEGFRFDLLTDEKPDYSGGGYASYLTGFLDDPDDDDADDCRSVTGYGPGMGTKSLTDLAPAYYKFGAEFYFWRMQEHEGSFFIGTLGQASLWRTDDGLDFSRIFTNGFDNPNNIGLRTFASTPYGLAVGTINPSYDAVDAEGLPAGGLEILLGTTALQNRAVIIPPIARAAVDLDPDKNGKQDFSDNDGDGLIEFFDKGGQFDSSAAGFVDVYLKDDGSYAPFAREPLQYEWYEGALPDCANPAPLPVCSSTTLGQAVGCKFTNIPASQGADLSPEHTFTLRVFNTTDGSSCDTLTVTASANLPPIARVIPSIPFNSANRVNLINFDGTGYESYDVTGICSDPANETIVRCEWVRKDGGSTLSYLTDCDPSNADACEISAKIDVARSDIAQAYFGTATPKMALEVEDAYGYTSSFSFETLVQSAVPDSDPNTNIAPVCRNAVLETNENTPLTINPSAALADGYPICLDRDGNPLVYFIYTPLASHGTAAAVPGAPWVLAYNPHAGFLGEDKFHFLASDSNPNTQTRYSQNVAIQVTVMDPVCTIGSRVIGPANFVGTITRSSKTSITTSGSVVIEAGADVTFRAPSHTFGPGFSVKAGAVFHAIPADVECN